MAEIWMDLKGYNGKYQVSNLGRVHSVYSNKILKPKTDKDGYEEYCLTLPKGKKKYERGHRLVALMFCEKPKGNNVVNHKNLIKNDNRAENLEWSTVALNTKHAYDNCEKIRRSTLKASKKGAEVSSYKLKVFKYGKCVGSYESQKECAKALKIDRKTIYNSMANSANTVHGYTFVKAGDANASKTQQGL